MILRASRSIAPELQFSVFRPTFRLEEISRAIVGICTDRGFPLRELMGSKIGEIRVQFKAGNTLRDNVRSTAIKM